MVQEPLTSLEDDVAATKRILDLQNGPCILVAHNFGGSVITVAGMDPHVIGLVYPATHAPMSGRTREALESTCPVPRKSRMGRSRRPPTASPPSIRKTSTMNLRRRSAARKPNSSRDLRSRRQLRSSSRQFRWPMD